KFAGRGAGGVSGVGGERETARRCALSDTVTARFTHGHPGQRDVGSSPQRPTRTQEAQIRKQERGIHDAEWLLRTQNGQNRNHQRHGLLGLEQRCDDHWTMGLDNKGSVCSHLRRKKNNNNSPSDRFS
ncbi:hypothetical protein E3U43_006949, partial [Larimichthys crocea]